MDQLLPLSVLKPGESAEIQQLAGQDDEVHRLQEMGLREGASIEMVQPGSPCIVRIAERKLCFRNGEVFSVLVRPEGVR